MKQHLSGVVRRIALGAAIAFGLTATGFAQTESDLNPDAPDRCGDPAG